MAQPVSIEFQRRQVAYRNAEFAFSIAHHEQGKVPSAFLSERIRAVSNMEEIRAPFFHRLAGQKGDRHD